MTIRPKQGAGGKWRWHLYEGSSHQGMSSIVGFDTQDEAIEHAKQWFGGPVYLETSGALLYAGQRDFSD